MELLNLAFIILLVKLCICVLPAVSGVFLIVMPEEKKREIRNQICNKLFGLSNAIAYPKFERALYVIGGLLLLVSMAATWFLLIAKLVSK